MGFGDPDHHHPLIPCLPKNDANCFRCQLPFMPEDSCCGCIRCSHFVHELCFGLPQNMTHPLHPEHSLSLLPSPSSEIAENCKQCLQPFVGGYAYHCQTCLNFNLHLKCFLTLNLEKKHHHPLRLWEGNHEKDCRICGLVIDHSDSYAFACKKCYFFIHFDCTFLPPTVKHRHVHELTFQYNFPEGSKIVDCDVCLNTDGKELDRALSYYYCGRCDYITHVRCVTSQPAKVATQFDHFVHEHPLIFLRYPFRNGLNCDACKTDDDFDSFYFCTICNFALHKSCARFPHFIKHLHNKENHTLSLHSSTTQDTDAKQVSCELCTNELEGNGWIFQCSDCDYAQHLSCAREFEHPLYKDRVLSFSFYKETKFRCNACGELGDGFRMSHSRYHHHILLQPYFGLPRVDLHLQCFGLPGKIEHGSHAHPLYLVTSPTEIESYLLTMFQCDICHTEADPDLWVYCCVQCKYIAHLKCAVSDLLPASGRSSDLSDLCSIAMCKEENFRVSTKPVDCLKFVELKNYGPLFLPRGFFNNPKPPVGDHNGQPITSDSDNSFMYVLQCPKCDDPISAQAYSHVYDWIHRNLKADIYTNQIETPADHESLALLDEKEVDELYCPVCNLLIFPPTYSCVKCQIFFHKSCVELPRKYTMDAAHTFVLRSLSMNNYRLTNCSKCERPFKGYAYFCASCEIGFDVTCALGAPLLKLENQKHSFCASTSIAIYGQQVCKACSQEIGEEKIRFRCISPGCRLELHVECAMLPSMVKVERRIHHHPLVLEPHLDVSVDDYICDVCEEKLNPCIWVYRCSDVCGDRATSHVSCIVTSNKKCHFIYNKECSYPHLEYPVLYNSLVRKMEVPALAAALVNTPPEEKYSFLLNNLLWFVCELEHEYWFQVTRELMKMEEAEVLHLMESPDALRAKVAETMKGLMSILLDTDDEDDEEENDENEVDTENEEKEDEDREIP